MEDLKVLVRNQYIIGSNPLIKSVKDRYKTESKEFIALCLGIRKGVKFPASTAMDILKVYYGNNKRKLNSLKKKYGYVDIETFMKEEGIKFISPNQIYLKDLDLIKCYAEFLKQMTEKILKIEGKEYSFYEYFQIAIQSPKGLSIVKQNKNLINYLLGVLPKFNGETSETSIYAGYLYTTKRVLNYEEILDKTLSYLKYPYPFNESIITKIFDYYTENGTIDLSMSDTLIHLCFLLSEVEGKPFAQIFNDFKFTDLTICYPLGVWMYRYGDDLYKVIRLSDFNKQLVLTSEHIRKLHRLGALYEYTLDQYGNEIYNNTYIKELTGGF